MVRYRSSFVLAGTGAGLLISIFLIERGPRLGEAGVMPLQVAAADLEMKQRELAAAVEARATTLAQLPRLAWAVATDAATIRDLTTDELGFRAQAGEIIEVAQIQRATSLVTPLLNVPANTSLRPPMTQVGPHLLVSGDQLFVALVVAIEPREHPDVVRGALVVARPLEVENTTKQLIRAGISARLVASNGSVTLTRFPALARQPEVIVPVGATSLRLIARLPPARTGLWIRILFGTLILLFWIMAVVLAIRAAALGGARLPAFAKLPSDADSFVDLLVTEKNIIEPGNGFHLHNGEAPLITEVAPISESEVNSHPIADGHAQTQSVRWSTADLKALFHEFMDVRTRCGDKSKAPALHDFVSSLQERRAKMMEIHAASDVLFQIVFIDGRAMVRARAVVGARA